MTSLYASLAPIPSIPILAPAGVGGFDWIGFDISVLDKSFFELIKIGISFYYLFSPEHEELWVPPCKSGYKSNTFFEKEEGIREIFP